MRAAVVESFGAPPRYAEFADPVPAEDEVLVAVTAVGLHPIVRSLAAGTHYGSAGVLPFIPGLDGVGRLDDGSRVFFGAARSPFGSFAQRCITQRNRCLAIPDNLDDATVAAMMNPGMSSFAALTQRIQFAAGQSVLIIGATGSAGHLAVQIARRLGAARIVAAGRNPQALEELRSLGADSTISLSLPPEALVSAFRDEIAAHKIDVILDYVWGAPAESVLAAIAQKGLDHTGARIRYVQIGSIAGPTISLPAATLRSSGLEIVGSGFGSVSLDKLFQSLATFLEEAAKAPFRINIVAAPLCDVETLWNSPEPAGRIVFQP